MAFQHYEAMIGQTAVDNSGNKVGKVGQLYLDDQTGQPQWITVSTGLFGTKESFAPVAGSRIEANNLVLAVSKDQIKNAPSMDADGHLAESEIDALYAHYRENSGFGGDERAEKGPAAGTARADTSSQTTADAMTRSEERLSVGTEKVEVGRARLRKHVVTETVSTSVPVSHDEVRIDREPITDDNRAQSSEGGALAEEEREVILNAERPVVTKETVPVERVRIGTETVTENETVSEQVSKEQTENSVIEGHSSR